MGLKAVAAQAGSQGSQGAQGAQGTQGFQGTQGTAGAQGNQGFQGNQGTQGAQGAQGTAGTNSLPLNSQTADYPTVLADGNQGILHAVSDNNPRTFTIVGAQGYAVGTTLTFVNEINTVTIAISTDTMVLAGAGTTGSRTLGAQGMATAIKKTSTTWMISGNGLT